MGENEPHPDSPPPLWPFLLLCATTAVWIDFGSIHRLHNADSIVPILTSLYHWTPYYWATNRFGMFVPLLAIPCKHPLANLLVQDGLMIFSGLAVLFLLPRYVLRNHLWPYAAILSTAIFLLVAPETYRFSYLVEQCYALSLALGLGGLLLTEPTPKAKFPIARSLLALLLIGLAHWVNVGIGLLLALLVVLRFLSNRRFNGKPCSQVTKDETLHALMTLSIGFSLGMLSMQLAPYHETAEGICSPDQWIQGWLRLASNTWSALAPHYWPLCLLLIEALALSLQLSLGGFTPSSSVSVRESSVVILTAFFYAAFVGVLEWVERGGFRERYTIPSVLFLHAGLSILAVTSLSSLTVRAPRKLIYAVAPLVLLAAGSRYGIPSVSGVQDILNERIGTRTMDVLEGRCTHVVGNYWVIWPTVFHANLVRHQRGEPGTIWGVSFRSDPMREQIRQVPARQLRIAVPHGDKDASGLFREYHFPPLDRVETRRTVAILCPVTSVPTP